MFAPKVLGAQTKESASSTGNSVHGRFALAVQPPRSLEQALLLQRTIGNQATMLYLKDQLSSSATAIEQDEPEAGPAAREGSRLPWDFGNIRVFPPPRTGQSQMQSPITASSRAAAIRPKLEVGRVDDPLEHEADRVADQVMGMPDTELYRTSAPAQLGRKCETCEEEEDRRQLHTKPAGEPETVGHEAPHSSVHEVLRSSGQSLDAPTRAYFEGRFGHEFGGVRVHTDARAAASARAVNAQAYTVGHDIVFGAGSFAPQTQDGRRLIAHELTHVVQQSDLEGGHACQTIQRQAGGGPHVVGPAYSGSCGLTNGSMKYLLSPVPGLVNVHIEFTPTAALLAAKTISFIQTMSESLTSLKGIRGFFGWGQTSSIQPEVDVLPSDKDPFYGAKWNQAAGKWEDEPRSTQIGGGPGSRPATATTGSAVINDSPGLNVGETKTFQTVATVVETGQVLGGLLWTIERWQAGLLNQGSSTTIVNAQCFQGASADFPAVVEKFYSGDGNVVLDGFAKDNADLPANYVQTLDPVLDQLQKNPAKRVLVGGAATADEAQPAALSLSRAERVKAYLVLQRIAESRIDMESYGSDWARTPVTEPGASKANRRVQIRLV